MRRLAGGDAFMRCRCTVVPSIMLPKRCVSQRPPPRDAGADTDGTLVLDTTEEWIKGHVDRAVREGRQTGESAAYFESIMDDQQEFRQYVQEARRLLGDQDPRALTKYQQGHYAERLSRHMSGVAAERLMRAHTEDTNARRHTRDGTPTGENYWFEAGNTLASPSVPDFVKDEVLREMREGRKKTSPAFEEPGEVEDLAAADKEFAEHLRQQRQRLLCSDDVLK
ncbi:hypothetical protein DQ04_07081010 [Trypanosoma grayi]|uniref:hypothetical protein n=1 Tax=Trypanosoma grayi TaxID=71804 RepID=UPI0004F4B8AC|nr:hypothetical protein DQ04_07081010 [Trypanosoma grayi]KEG08482.1 hypothetical protein DQ04_07081010 [Trypanosoma grayi]